MSKPIILFGTSILSEMIAREAASSADFCIAAFTVDAAYRTGDTFLGRPLVDFERMTAAYPPADFDLLLCFSGRYAMRRRAELYDRIKSAGYTLRNFISPLADCASDLILGDNNIILAHSHIGLHGRMGDNNLIRQHVYLGHNFQLGDHIFIAPGTTIGGFCQIGSLSYLALGVTVNSRVRISPESLIGSGALVLRDTEPFSKNIGSPARAVAYHPDTGIVLEGL